MKTKVLLVDDEKDFVESLSERLDIRNFDVTCAYNGDEALKFMQDQDFDVIILDVMMPGKDGVETLQEIKKIKPLTQVIMLTGNATVETAINGMKLGAYDYLMKPTDTEILVEKIDKACQLKQEHDERIQQAEINNIVKRKGW
ncbi:MAG: response regulator [Deltaproteobacteria bacterium]|nr:response regulator [Deltaproteobacteria bacterium]